MPVPRVDFYLVTETGAQAPLLLCCRLLEKAYQQQHKVYVQTPSQQEAEALDELLWTFKDECFIPHNLQGEGPKLPPPYSNWLANARSGVAGYPDFPEGGY